MNKKLPLKGKDKSLGTSSGPNSKPGIRIVPAKKAVRPAKAKKSTSCFDGAGDLNPTKTKVGQPK